MSRGAAARRLLLVLALAAGGYLAGANLFLNTPLAEWAVNRRPERLRLTWRAAWTFWPGDLRVRGLEVAALRRRLPWSLRVERGRGRLGLLPLLRREVRLEDVKIARLGALRLGPLRLDGKGTAAGSLRLAPGRETRLELERFDLRGTTLRAGRATIARDARLAGSLRLGPYAPRRHRGLRGFDFLSGSLRLAGGGPGRLLLDLAVRDGRLLPGSRAIYSAVRTPEAARLVVRAEVKAAPGGPRLALDGSAAGVAVYRPGGAFESDALRLAAATAELRLSRLLAARRATLWGQLDGERVRLDLSGRRVAWTIALPRAAARIDLPALIRRELRLAGLRGEGADVRVGIGPPPAARPGPPRRRWSVRLTGARLAGAAAMEVRDLALTAGVEAAGGFAWRDGKLALDRTAFTVAQGRARRGAETLADGLTARGTTRLDPFAPGSLRGAANLRPLSTDAELAGRLASLGFLDVYLKKAPWLDLRGDGPFTATLRLDHGRLAPGSRLRIAPARVEAEYLTSRARGSAIVTGAVEPRAGAPALDLQVLFGRFEVAARAAPGALPHLRGSGLRMTVTTDDLDLTHAERDLRLRVHLPAAEAPDLAAFNGYLPPDAGVAILGGAGRLRSDLELETAGNSGRGELVLTSNNVRLRFHDLGIAGGLDLRARLAAADLTDDRFRLDGTRLVLERVSWSELDGGAPSIPGPAPGAWWGHFDLERGTVRLTRPLALQSTVAARLKDAGLLLALFARRQRALGWLQGVLAEERLAARAELRFADGAIVLDPLVVAGRRLDLRTRLRLSPESKRGYLFVRYGRLATGIELEDGERTYHLRRPLEWYKSQRGFR